MGFVLDTHTHTIASAHAYSTVAEMAKAAGDRGLGLLAVTDHGPALADSSHKLHFMNYHVLPKEMRGVRMLYGAELNILDFEGNVDLDEDILKRQDICIASFHTACTKAGTMEENTQAYLKAMENPYVNIIGHPEDGYVPVDFERLVKKAKEQKVLLEINNSSIKTAFYRLNTRENMKAMLKLCRQHEVHVSLGTDAHYAGAVGVFDQAAEVLREVDFPLELVANTSVEAFMALLDRRSGDDRQVHEKYRVQTVVVNSVFDAGSVTWGGFAKISGWIRVYGLMDCRDDPGSDFFPVRTAEHCMDPAGMGLWRHRVTGGLF